MIVKLHEVVLPGAEEKLDVESDQYLRIRMFLHALSSHLQPEQLQALVANVRQLALEPGALGRHLRECASVEVFIRDLALDLSGQTDRQLAKEKKRAGATRSKPVCPTCSSSVFYSHAAGGGYDCGYCDATFSSPAEGCSLSVTGEHDEAWMNDGFCACGANGSANLHIDRNPR